MLQFLVKSTNFPNISDEDKVNNNVLFFLTKRKKKWNKDG